MLFCHVRTRTCKTKTGKDIYVTRRIKYSPKTREMSNMWQCNVSAWKTRDEGTGLKRIVDAYNESNCRCEFEVQKSGFVVIFYHPETESRSDDPINHDEFNETILLDPLRAKPASTYSELADSLSVSQATIKRMLQKLVARRKSKEREATRKEAGSPSIDIGSICNRGSKR